MSDAKMTEAILQTATDLTVGVIIAYLEEENPNGFDDDGYPIVHDLSEPTALEDAIHALTEWALNWHDLGKPPTPARWEIYTEAGYALELLHRVQENFAPDEMRGLKYSDYIGSWFLPDIERNCTSSSEGIMARLKETAPLFGFDDQDILEMWVLIKELKVAPRSDQA